MNDLRNTLILCAIILLITAGIVAVLIATRTDTALIPLEPEERIQQDDSASSSDMDREHDTDPTETETMSFSLKSTAFEDGGEIPSRFTCDGANVSPPFVIQHVPQGTASLALIMDDPDIPQSVKDARGIDEFDHWVVFNIAPDTTAIAEGVEPRGTPGSNSRGQTGYTGPCPPDREHRYFFKLYALDTMLELPPGTAKATLEAAMEPHTIERAELMGRYERIQ